jgi:hypothetical protein
VHVDELAPVGILQALELGLADVCVWLVDWGWEWRVEREASCRENLMGRFGVRQFSRRT